MRRLFALTLLGFGGVAVAEEPDAAEAPAPLEAEAPGEEALEEEEAAEEEALEEEEAAEEALAIPEEPSEPPAAGEEAVAEEEPAEEEGVAEEEERRDFFSGEGNALMLSYGAMMGAYVGGSLGYLADPDGGRGILPGILAGSAAVPLTVYLAAGNEEITADQAVLVGSAGGLGAYTGLQAARMFIPPGDQGEHPRIVLAGVLGNMAGTGLGVALMPVAPSQDRLWALDLGAVIGWQSAAAASTLMGWQTPEHRQRRAGLALAGAYGMGGAMYALRTAGAPPPTPSLSAISLAHGTWIGLWAPSALGADPRGRDVWAGLRLGLGTGYIASQLLAPLVDPSPRSVTLQLTGIAAGNALGAGIPMALGRDPFVDSRPVVLPMLAGGVVGQGLGALVSPYWDITEEDAMLLSVLGLWTGYQAIGWGFYGSHLPGSPTVRTGAALTAAGSGTLLALTVAPLIDVSPAESMLIGTAGGWGTWYGGWLGHLFDAGPQAHWVTTLSVGNAALLGTAALTAGPLDATWTDVALINGLTAVGGATGALVGVVASPDLDTVATAGLVGTTLGLGTGIYLAARSPGGASGLAFLPDVPALERLPVTPGLAVTPWADEVGNPGVWVELSLRERP